MMELGSDLDLAQEAFGAERRSQFVDLWRDADEELQPQVREIRQRVARLVGEP